MIETIDLSYSIFALVGGYWLGPHLGGYSLKTFPFSFAFFFAINGFWLRSPIFKIISKKNIHDPKFRLLRIM
jgi:hypothetical protein